MLRFCTIALILLFPSLIYSQDLMDHPGRVAPETYWLFFTDKEDNGYDVSRPDEFLTGRSIERRGWQGIPVDQIDLPVTANYLDSLVSLGLNVMHTSKWLNGVLVSGTDIQLLDSIYNYSFIDSIMWSADPSVQFMPDIPTGGRFEPPYPDPLPFAYGLSTEQISQLRLDVMHQRGYTGNGVRVAVLDGGFKNMTDLPAFQKIYEEGRVLAAKSFVIQGRELYNAHYHGMSVSSIIAGYWPDTLMGGAPDVELLLAMTENVDSETRIEEYSWIMGAEWADSLGADILNTSLGYSVFDDSTTNYTIDDLDGVTAHISLANGFTASRGIVSVTSAGNEGNGEWGKITAPSDAQNILSVAAVDQDGVLAAFSSRGPTYDQRIRPNISAMGYGTAVQNEDGTARRGAGTSYSSPMIAAAAAVLWQAHPQLTARELMQWMLESSDRSDLPDVEYGYGIPSINKAYYAVTDVPQNLFEEAIRIYPNPFTDHVYMEGPLNSSAPWTAKLYDLSGRMILERTLQLPSEIGFDPELDPGIYFLDISQREKHSTFRLIKQ